jgi:hypothetical protein
MCRLNRDRCFFLNALFFKKFLTRHVELGSQGCSSIRFSTAGERDVDILMLVQSIFE